MDFTPGFLGLFVGFGVSLRGDFGALFCVAVRWMGRAVGRGPLKTALVARGWVLASHDSVPCVLRPHSETYVTLKATGLNPE